MLTGLDSNMYFDAFWVLFNCLLSVAIVVCIVVLIKKVHTWMNKISANTEKICNLLEQENINK